MEQIAVLVFEHDEAGYWTGSQSGEEKAQDAYKELEAAAKKGEVQIESATIVVKKQDGGVKLSRTSEWTAGKGAGRGAFWGLLVGLILGGPVAGLLAGLGCLPTCASSNRRWFAAARPTECRLSQFYNLQLPWLKQPKYRADQDRKY